MDVGCTLKPVIVVLCGVLLVVLLLLSDLNPKETFLTFSTYHGGERAPHQPLRGGSEQSLFGPHVQCTKALFREHNKVFGYFPSGGTWEDVKYNGENVTTFFPTACHFRWPNLTEIRTSCPKALDWLRIAIMGPCHGGEYTRGLVDILKTHLGFKCQGMRRERNIRGDHSPDGEYFARGNSELNLSLQLRQRHCHGCLSTEIACQLNTPGASPRVHVEYVGMDDVIDSSVRLFNDAVREQSIETYQEFLFRVYFKDRYPDIVIITPSWNHVKFKDSPEKFRADLIYFRALFRVYFPNSTSIYWVPGLRENEINWFLKGQRYRNQRVDGMLASERIDLFNHILFDIVRTELINSTSLLYGFLDQIQSSEDRGSWYRDRVHLDPRWHKTTAAFLLELICS